MKDVYVAQNACVSLKPFFFFFPFSLLLTSSNRFPPLTYFSSLLILDDLYQGYFSLHSLKNRAKIQRFLYLHGFKHVNGTEAIIFHSQPPSSSSATKKMPKCVRCKSFHPILIKRNFLNMEIKNFAFPFLVTHCLILTRIHFCNSRC